MGSDTSGTLDLERLDIGSCGSERVLMATLGVGCGVIVLKSPHVTFCTLGDGCKSWCDGAIGRTGVAGRGEASSGCTCPCNCRECRTFAGDMFWALAQRALPDPAQGYLLAIVNRCRANC